MGAYCYRDGVAARDVVCLPLHDLFVLPTVLHDDQHFQNDVKRIHVGGLTMFQCMTCTDSRSSNLPRIGTYVIHSPALAARYFGLPNRSRSFKRALFTPNIVIKNRILTFQTRAHPRNTVCIYHPTAWCLSQISLTDSRLIKSIPAS